MGLNLTRAGAEAAGSDHVPVVGERTREILKLRGVEHAEIDTLVERHVVGRRLAAPR